MSSIPHTHHNNHHHTYSIVKRETFKCGKMYANMMNANVIIIMIIYSLKHGWNCWRLKHDDNKIRCSQS